MLVFPFCHSSFIGCPHALAPLRKICLHLNWCLKRNYTGESTTMNKIERVLCLIFISLFCQSLSTIFLFFFLFKTPFNPNHQCQYLSINTEKNIISSCIFKWIRPVYFDLHPQKFFSQLMKLGTRDGGCPTIFCLRLKRWCIIWRLYSHSRVCI